MDETNGTHKKTLARRASIKRNSAVSTTKEAKQRVLGSVLPLTTTPTETAPETTTETAATSVMEQATFTTPHSTASLHQRPPLSSGAKKPRRDGVLASPSAEAQDKKTVAAAAATPPEASKDTTAAVAAAAKALSGVSTSNSSPSNAMSRVGSLRLSTVVSSAPPNSLFSPINEIHGSLAQLYLTPISTSLSSSSQNAAFSGLHFDGRSASWSNGAAAAANSGTNGAHAGSRCDSGSSSAARLRNTSFGDHCNSSRHSGDSSGSASAATESSFLVGQQQQQQPRQRTLTQGPTLYQPRARDSFHFGGDGRSRPTFSDASPEIDVVDTGLLTDSTSIAGVSKTLSVTNTTLLTTTSTVAVPMTPPMPPPMPPPLASTVKPSSASFAGRRLPPTPPRLEGEGSSRGEPERRRGSWKLTSSWVPASSSPTSLLNSLSPIVVRASRRVSSVKNGETSHSNSVLELAEGPFASGHEAESFPWLRSPQKPSTVVTAPFANSGTAAVPGSDTASRQPCNDDGDDASSAIEDTMSSVSVSVSASVSASLSCVSASTSTFDEVPPPTPAPPAQLNLGGGVGGDGYHVPLPLPHSTQKTSLTLGSPVAADPSVSLFLDTNTWHPREEGGQGRNSTSASFSVRPASIASLFPNGDAATRDDHDGENNNSSSNSSGHPQPVRHTSFFSTSEVSLAGAKPFMLCPPSSVTAAVTPSSSGNTDDNATEYSLIRHGASYGVKRGSWTDGVGGGGDGLPPPPPLSLQPDIDASKTEEAGGPLANVCDGGDGDAEPPKAPPALRATEQADAFPPVASPLPEPSLVIKKRVSSAASRMSANGAEIISRQQELAQSFRSRIQVGVRAPKRKQTVRRVSSSARSQRRSNGSSSSSQRSSSVRSGSSSSSGSSRRRSGNSRRSGKNGSGALACSGISNFIRAGFFMLACAKFMKAVVACRARHRYEEVDAPRAAYCIECAWRRHQQRRRIRERNAVQLLVPWLRLRLRRLRKTKERSALLLQRVFRGQADRSFHQFLYARMQYNKALEVVLRAVRRWEAQKMLSGLRLQRDERVVLIGHCIQGYRQVFRAEQLEWGALVDRAAATLGTRPCVTTRDWVSGVAARTGVVLNPAATASGDEDLFVLGPSQAVETRGSSTRVDALRQQVLRISQLESYAYLDPARRTRKMQEPLTGYLEASVDVHTLGTAAPATVTAEMAFGDTTEMTAHSSELSPAPAVSDDDVVVAYIQLLLRTESAERVELERALLAEQEAMLRTPSLVNQAVAYIVQQQLPLLFAPLLLSMSSKSMMRKAVCLFEAERSARCQIITLYESMPLTFLSRPMLNPAARLRHDNLVELVTRAPDPWLEAEQNERRLYQEWIAYQGRSNGGTSDSRTPATPTLPPMPNETSVSSPHLEIVTPVPIFLEKSQDKDASVSDQVSATTQRPVVSGGGGVGIRVRMIASLRGTVTAPSATQSVSSTVLTPPLTSSASVSAEPSDSYARVDVKSKTEIPCPKRRPRGPPLPLLRTLVPVTARGQNTNPRSRPSFRGSCSSLPTQSQLALHAPDPTSATMPATHRISIVPGLVAPASLPSSVLNKPTRRSGNDVDDFSSLGHLNRGRGAVETHPLSVAAGSFTREASNLSDRMVLLPMTASPLRTERRDTAAPPSPSPAAVTIHATTLTSRLPNFHGGVVGPVVSQSPRASQVRIFSDDERDKTTESGEEAAASRHALQWLDASRMSSKNSSNSSSVRLVPVESHTPLAPSLSSNALGGAVPSAAEKLKNEKGKADTRSSIAADPATSPLQRQDSWASSSLSSSSSSVPHDSADAFCIPRRYGAESAAGNRAASRQHQQQQHIAATALLRRPPTPPPRRCYTTEAAAAAAAAARMARASPGFSLSFSPPSSSSASKEALKTVVTAVFHNATANSSSPPGADELRPAAPQVDASTPGNQLPEGHHHSSSSNTSWTLSPMPEPMPPSPLPQSFASSAVTTTTRLPGRQTSKRSFGFTL